MLPFPHDQLSVVDEENAENNENYYANNLNIDEFVYYEGYSGWKNY
jgi:hypothetical protein